MRIRVFRTTGISCMPPSTTKAGIPIHRIEVGMKPRFRDPAGEHVRHQLADDLGIEVDGVQVIDVYTVHADIDAESMERVRRELFTDPIIQDSALNGSIA